MSEQREMGTGSTLETRMALRRQVARRRAARCCCGKYTLNVRTAHTNMADERHNRTRCEDLLGGALREWVTPA
jgi:hypothetical protein